MLYHWIYGHGRNDVSGHFRLFARSSYFHQPGSDSAAASIIAKIWSSRKLLTWKAFAGQIPAQMPQPMHLTSLCEIIRPVDERRTEGTDPQAAQAGHAQRPFVLGDDPGDGQPLTREHDAGAPGRRQSLTDRLVEVLRRMAESQTNSPSLGKSTGRSLTCASR